jgi:hypothetical protein
MNAPVWASTKTRSVVAGDGQGRGVAAYGPHENGNDPACSSDRSAQFSVRWICQRPFRHPLPTAEPATRLPRKLVFRRRQADEPPCATCKNKSRIGLEVYLPTQSRRPKARIGFVGRLARA